MYFGDFLDLCLVFRFEAWHNGGHAMSKAKEHGCIIGSSSDRPLPVQQTIWDRFDIEVSFVSAKHQLPDIKTKFPADRYYHIGDTEIDEQYAKQAGFDFLWEQEGLDEPWIT